MMDVANAEELMSIEIARDGENRMTPEEWRREIKTFLVGRATRRGRGNAAAA
jgi:hypothetical protein